VIRINITIKDLENEIEAEKPGWLANARKAIKALQGVDDPNFDDMWGDIKQAYIVVQRSKCGFCEKPLEGKIEQDVEHFRPKKAIHAWQVPSAVMQEITAAGFRVAQPTGGPEPGYKYLAYHHLNYLTACKNCNSIRKKNYFPIAGRRKRGGRNPADMTSEYPYLVYPLSTVDDDPEQLIEFVGVFPRPKRGLKGFGRLRALVTIAVFGLDDEDGRKDLLIDRIETLEKVYFALKGRQEYASAADRDAAQTVIDRYTSGRFRHTNCMRCFVRVYQRSRAEAERLYQAAIQYLKSVST
jgi:hypothetical protein